MKIVKLLILFLILNIASVSVFAKSSLYPGEKLIEINRIQTLFKFIKGDQDKPLMIFIPGASHLARISYGFPGGREDDFLSYWLHKAGYSFLGVSYPTDNPVFTKIYPSFTIQDWGHQITTLAQMIINENHLSPHVVLIGWSMGGNVEEAATEALEKRNIRVEAFIGLSAVTPLSYMGQTIKGYKGNEMLPNKLLDARYFYKFFIQLMAEQSTYNGHEIIPEQIYIHQFLGSFPVALEGQGYYFMNNRFVFDPKRILDDSGVFRFEHTPWIALVHDDSIGIPKITLIDVSAWNYLRSEMIYSKYMDSSNISNKPDQFLEAKNILNQSPQFLSASVHGNHFFFVGKQGAEETAKKIILILQHVYSMKTRLKKTWFLK